MNLSGLAFVGQGYDQGAQNFWRRQQLEMDFAAQQALGQAMQGGLAPQGAMPGAMQAQPLPGLPPPPSAQPTDVAGLDPQQGPPPGSFADRWAGLDQLPPQPLPNAAPLGMVNPQRVAGQPQNLTGPIIPSGGMMNPSMMVAGPGAPSFAGGGAPGASPVQRSAGGPPGPPQAPPGAPGQGQPPTTGAPGGMPAPQPSALQPITQPMGWEQIVNRIVQANPGAPPEVLVRAAQLAVPLMQLSSKQEQQAITNRLHELQLELQNQKVQQGNRRLDQGESRLENARRNTDSLIEYRQFREKWLDPVFKADAGALAKLTQAAKAMESFENTAIRNGDTLMALAEKVDTTGMPVFERWIRAGRQAIAGDPDVTKFNFQYESFITESARVIQNPNLTGVLPVTVRREFQEALPKSSSAQQFRETFEIIKQDFRARKEEMQATIDRTKGELKGEKPTDTGPQKPAQASPGGPVKVTTPEEARKLPKGTRILLPDGTEGVVP